MALTWLYLYIHAGAIAAIADSAAGYAAFSLCPPDSTVLTAEYKINLLAPGKGEALVARAKVIKSGKTLKIAFSEVFAVENGSEKLCAVLMATIMVLHNRSDSGA